MRKILSTTPVETYVHQGLSLGLVLRHGRIGVTINDDASRNDTGSDPRLALPRGTFEASVAAARTREYPQDSAGVNATARIAPRPLPEPVGSCGSCG